MIIIGIDVGFKGGIAYLKINKNNINIKYESMPIKKINSKIYIDLDKLIYLLSKEYIYSLFNTKDEKIIPVIERVTAMPNQGVVSMFRFGEEYGMIQALCKKEFGKYELITPRKWKQLVNIHGSNKQKSKDMVHLLFNIKTNKDGIADSILIAYAYIVDNKLNMIDIII